jgi:hypothetical protein
VTISENSIIYRNDSFKISCFTNLPIFINMGRRLTTEEFIIKAKKVHGDKYKYLNEYLGSKKYMLIECGVHGEFEQKPNCHLNGDGCSKCSGKYKPTNEEFIIKAKSIHGDRYDYSTSFYINNKTKIEITCSMHGIFKQTPDCHINKKQGCPVCGTKQNATNEEFITKTNLIHGNKYDYSLVEYINSKTKVKIICPMHGVFEQTPNNHIFGYGCVRCNGPIITDFIQKAKSIHNNKYDYSLVEYVNSNVKINILCPKHGVFSQKLNDHLYGNGCPICRESIGEKKIRTYLLDNKINFLPQHRFKDCKYKNTLPFDFYLPEHNICIEYNGVQHYEYRKFFHRTKNALSIQQLKDNIKKQYCDINGISLLIIKYDENINNKLNKIC